MKDLRPKIVQLFKQGYCTPQIARIAKHLKEPSTTIHYNIKKLEHEGAVKAYKAVFDYAKIGEGYCNFLLINLKQEKYGRPEEIVDDLAKNEHVESIDIVTGDYEMIVKCRFKDINEYYEFARHAIKKYHFGKIISLASLKQIKTEFVIL